MPFEKQAQPMAPGVEIHLPGQMVIVPELSLGQREDHEELIDEAIRRDRERKPLEELEPEERRKTVREANARAVKLVALALSRNYPEVTHEEVRSLFTINDLVKGMRYALGAGKEDKPGEAGAAATAASA